MLILLTHSLLYEGCGKKTVISGRQKSMVQFTDCCFD